MRVRLTVCSHCGHEGRLVIATPEQVISRCHVCGDELRSQAPLPVAEVRGVAVEPLPAAAARVRAAQAS